MAYSGGIYVGAAIGTVARVEHACFLGSGFLFWWPVVQPWPSVPRWPRWSMLLYLFLATLPCDILSAFLAFCDRVVYTVYLPHQITLPSPVSKTSMRRRPDVDVRYIRVSASGSSSYYQAAVGAQVPRK